MNTCPYQVPVSHTNPTGTNLFPLTMSEGPELGGGAVEVRARERVLGDRYLLDLIFRHLEPQFISKLATVSK